MGWTNRASPESLASMTTRATGAMANATGAAAATAVMWQACWQKVLQQFAGPSSCDGTLGSTEAPCPFSIPPWQEEECWTFSRPGLAPHG